MNKTQVTFDLELLGQTHQVAVQVAPGTTLLEAALKAQVPLEHACEGCCACSTCHVIVQEGTEGLNEAQEEEEDRLDYAWEVQPTSRLACQARVGTSPVSVKVPQHSLDPASALEYFDALGASSAPTDVARKQVMTPQLGWEEAVALAEALERKYPELDPFELRLTELLACLQTVPEFGGAAESCNEAKLEKILAAWFELRGVA